MLKIKLFTVALLVLSQSAFAQIVAPPGAGGQMQQIPPPPIPQRAVPEIRIERGGAPAIPASDNVKIPFKSLQAAAADDAAQLSNLSRPLSAHEGAAAPSTIETQPVVAHRPKRANFERERASHEARHVADWVVDSGDNRSMPFVIVDKTDAKVFVFDADGRLRGAAPALLGLARGDHAVPGIGDREWSSIRPEERTTPAGRFVAALGRNLRGKEILWVDYDGAVSMHRVASAKPEERRLQRLATPTPLDNRISYGCINVPVKFYENVVSPAFTRTYGIVYVLPETRLAREVFASYDVEEHARLQTANQTVPAQVASGAARH